MKEKIDELRKGLPKGLRIDVFCDRSELIEACIETVTGAPRQQAALGGLAFRTEGRVLRRSLDRLGASFRDGEEPSMLYAAVGLLETGSRS